MSKIRKTSAKAIRKGKILGSVLWHAHFRRKIILKNLNIAFPDKDLHWKKSIGKRCFQSIASVLFEFLKLSSYFCDNKLDSILVIDKGRELLEQHRDTGAIIVSCHLGNWELAGAMISSMGIKLSVLAYRQKNGWVHNFMHKIRTTCKMAPIYHRDSMRPLISTLKQNKFIAFLADQNTTAKKGIFVNFFSKPAIAVDLPAKLAVKMKKPLLFFCNIYNEKDHMYHMELEELKSDQELNEKGDVEKIVRMYTDRIEEAIRQHPEQYLWFHKRWKTQPESEPGVY